MNSSVIVQSQVTKFYSISIIVLILFLLNSFFNLITVDTVYPTDILKDAFLTNDFVNIIICIPFLLIFVLSVKKISKLELSLSGIMLFIIYNQIVYSISIDLLQNRIINIIILLLSIYAYFIIHKSIDQNIVIQKFDKLLSKPVFSIILIILGILFITRAGYLLLNHFSGKQILTLPEVAVNISDLCICTLWIAVGILLFLNKTYAFSIVIGIYFQSSILFICLIFFLILRPLFTNMNFVLIDIIVIGIMSLICIIPYVFILTRKEDF